MLPLSPRLIVEPDDGLDPVREFINSAQNSLLIKQFTFTEPSLIAAVIDRKNAGVDVRVMLNAARSGGDRANDETYQQFQDAGISVKWSSSKFYVTHEKSIVVDEKVALVATFNLMEKYFTLTRDYGVITESPYHVAQIVEVFNADWPSAIGIAQLMKACCGAIPIRATTWRNSSTPPRNGSISSTRNTWTRSFLNASLPPPIAVSKSTFSAAASTASANGTFSIPSHQCGR
jgi:phosphatidylserine/phosphatidylglycerophosphate/cardiolipin synthase-like enzyme